MQEGDAVAEDAEAAGVNEVSDKEQRSLSKTRTNKRPRSDNKNKKPLSEYVVGEMCSGKIVSIMPYGAFVDVGTTTDGLVHVSQIADEFVSDIESVVKVGQEVECRILTVDSDANKISLSMRSESAPQKQGGGGGGRGGGRKELPDEFINFDEQKFLPGTVASVQDYGCFVSLNEDVDALVHVSEMAEERVSSPSAVVKVGQEVQVRIIKYDKASKRLSLSMKPWTESVKEEYDDVKQYVDPIPEDQKTSFAMAWEKAQAAAAK
jgi:small subunit ribosomal protein S1